MIDKTVSMSKVDVGGKEVEGAKIQVIDQEGNIIDEWTSGTEAHKIKGLVEGQTYTLHEEVAAEGYVKATDVEFTVSYEKTDDAIEMVDKIIDMTKEDVGGKELPGAKIIVFDEDMNVVDEWTSTEEAHKIIGLEEGKKYILHEDAAPAGYAIATDIEFTATTEKIDQHLTMTDKQVIINKLDQLNLLVKGAKLQVLDKDGTVVDEWTSEEAYAASNLKVGETYVLHEVEAPTNYNKAENIEFTVTDEKSDQFVTMVDIKTDDVEITKYDATNKKELAGAKLKVVDQKGNIIDQWTSTTSAHSIKGLIVGAEYTLIEETAPNGYRKTESITFKIADNGVVVQQVKMYDYPVRKDYPNTGVKDGMPIYLGLAAMSGLAAITLIVTKKKKED